MSLTIKDIRDFLHRWTGPGVFFAILGGIIAMIQINFMAWENMKDIQWLISEVREIKELDQTTVLQQAKHLIVTEQLVDRLNEMKKQDEIFLKEHRDMMNMIIENKTMRHNHYGQN